jgi:hypothetical protein
MPTVSLSSAFIRSVICKSPLRKVDHYDNEQRGFLLEVRANGRKTFYQRYTDDKGRTRQCKVRRFSVGCLTSLTESESRILRAWNR